MLELGDLSAIEPASVAIFATTCSMGAALPPADVLMLTLANRGPTYTGTNASATRIKR
jgi:hypothetical protein